MSGIQASVLALLAFILAITFGMAANRFEARKGMVLTEANAIGTAFLRAELLPEPDETEIKRLLVDYVDIRIEAVESEKLEAAIARSEDTLEDLWRQAVQVSDENPGSYGVVLFVQSLNEVIDVAEKRLVTGVYDRIPTGVWVALYLVSILAMLAVGYNLAVTGSRRSIGSLVLALAFSIVIVLIVDLDRPQTGTLRVGQQAMLDTRESMQRSEEVP